MAGGKIWTEIEIQYLKDHYALKHKNDIALSLGRSPLSVLVAANKLGLHKAIVVAGNGVAWTEKEMDFLKENYAIMSLRDLSIKFGRTEHAIESVANKNGFKKIIKAARQPIDRSQSKMLKRGRRWSDSEIEYIRKNYTNGNMESMCNYLNRDYNAIQSRGRSMGLNRNKELVAEEISQTASRNGHLKKYSVNSSFFKTWSDDMAYILGIIATDGNIRTPTKRHRQHQFSLGLRDYDKYLLENISITLKSSFPVFDNSKSKMSRFDIRDNELVNDLISFGLVPKKSRILKVPPIPANWFFSFLRGVIDGDGHITTKKAVITIASGSKDFVEGLRLCLDQFGFNSSIYSNMSKLSPSPQYVLRIGRFNQVLKLYDLMYSNSPFLFLDRKKDKYEIIKNKYSDKLNGDSNETTTTN